jgi:hypothetical protein
MFTAALALLAAEAQAGCGSAFCSLNTNWSTQGAWTEPGGRLDLRFEYIDQDQPRNGTHDVDVGEIPRHHDEVRTINRNFVPTYDYTINANWGVAVTAPVVSRNHEHIHNHMGVPEDEQWSFTDLGDARIVGRYRFTSASNGGVQFGLKLPTGKYDVTNDAGEVAERSLQPGSGTTDAIVGMFYNGTVLTKDSWFTDIAFIAPLAPREGYQPGYRFGADIGLSSPLTAKVALLMQLNALWKDHDHGENAEPEDTGGVFIYFSPGVSVALGDKTSAYGFVQIPLYQRVNGVQLVADWSVAAGVSRRF